MKPPARPSHVVMHFDLVFARTEIEAQPLLAKRPWVVVRDGAGTVRPVYAGRVKENMEGVAALLSGVRDLPTEARRHRWSRPRTRRASSVCAMCCAERSIVAWEARWPPKDLLVAAVSYRAPGRIGWDGEEPSACAPVEAPAPRKRASTRSRRSRP